MKQDVREQAQMTQGLFGPIPLRDDWSYQIDEMVGLTLFLHRNGNWFRNRIILLTSEEHRSGIFYDHLFACVPCRGSLSRNHTF
jgi:hypothetical protein